MAFNQQNMADAIRRQLSVILESSRFSASERLKCFLRFVVEETLEGREHELKAQVIGTKIFNRGNNFDSLTDPVVRVEAGKLRNKLNSYYLNNEEEGSDIIRIDIPKGSYVPSFKRISAIHPAKAPPMEALPGAIHSSIAILPFENMSESKEVDYLLSGLAEELTMALTKFEDITVISARGMSPESGRSSEPVDILAKQLGVRFVLRGSAQFVGTQMRLRINLVDAANRKILWAEKFESQYTVKNLFNIIDSTVTQVASRIGDSFGLIKRTLFNEFPDAERTEEIKAYEAVLCYHYWAANLASDRFHLAKTALEQAIQADPAYALPHGMLSDIYATHYQWSNDPQPEYLERSESLAARALALDPQCQYGLWGKGYSYFLRGDLQHFLDYAREAISINPSDTYLTAVVGVKIAAAGQWDEGRRLVHKASSLNPFLPSWHYTADSLYFFYNQDFEAALEAARHINSPSLSGPMLRTAIYGSMGLNEEARQELKLILGINPHFQKSYKELTRRIFFDASLVSALLHGFSRAGLPS